LETEQTANTPPLIMIHTSLSSVERVLQAAAERCVGRERTGIQNVGVDDIRVGRFLARLAVLTGLLLFACTSSASVDDAITELELAFLSDSSHRNVYRIEHLPEDVQQALFEALGTDRIRETEGGDDSLPRSADVWGFEHRFTMLSETTAAVLCVDHGITARQMIVLISRQTQGAIARYYLNQPIHSALEIRQVIEERLIRRN
jgi:hypothetical protein